jgi:hypothetical protein
MPNDCNNSFGITGITADQWQEIALTFQVRDQDHQQDFLKTFYPEPDYSVTAVARTYPKISAQYAETEEERERILKNEPTISEDSWWDWRVQNWGTKWDVYSCCNDLEDQQPSTEFNASFCTAWSPLSEQCMKVLSMRFPGAILTNYYEESGSDFCGVTVAKDGVVRNFSESISEYLEAFVRKNFPDLDARLEEEEQELDEFFCDNCEFGEFSEFISDAQQSRVKEIIQQVEAETQVLHAFG